MLYVYGEEQNEFFSWVVWESVGLTHHPPSVPDHVPHRQYVGLLSCSAHLSAHAQTEHSQR